MQYKITPPTDSPDLMLFFSGWASHYTYFEQIAKPSADFVFLYNYSSCTLPPEVEQLCSQKQRIVVVAWSYGVWVANIAMQAFAPKIANAIAINGTLQPVNEQYGIAPRIFEGTLAGLSEKTLQKFELRMCGQKEVYRRYASHASQRSLENVKTELEYLKTVFESKTATQNIFTFAHISKADNIIPTQNQINFWSKIVDYELTEGGHFPFADHNKWDYWVQKGNAPHKTLHHTNE